LDCMLGVDRQDATRVASTSRLSTPAHDLFGARSLQPDLCGVEAAGLFRRGELWHAS
jgi:hypothetical protein